MDGYVSDSGQEALKRFESAEKIDAWLYCQSVAMRLWQQ